MDTPSKSNRSSTPAGLEKRMKALWESIYTEIQMPLPIIIDEENRLVIDPRAMRQLIEQENEKDTSVLMPIQVVIFGVLAD